MSKRQRSENGNAVPSAPPTDGDGGQLARKLSASSARVQAAADHQSPEYTSRLISKASPAYVEPKRVELSPRDVPAIDILVVVVNENELNAVVAEVEPIDGVHYELVRDMVYYRIGMMTGKFVAVVQTDPSSKGTMGSQSVTYRSLLYIKPKVVVAVGVAFGTPGSIAEENKHLRMGDVLVSNSIIPYEHARINADGTRDLRQKPFQLAPELETLLKGEVKRAGAFPSSITSDEVEVPPTFKVHLGALMSGDKLVDNPEEHKRIFDGCKRANGGKAPLGGEMEGVGLADSMTLGDGVPFVVIKAICDWGFGKSKGVQPAAARHSAIVLKTFIPHLARLDRRYAALAIDKIRLPVTLAEDSNGYPSVMALIKADSDLKMAEGDVADLMTRIRDAEAKVQELKAERDAILGPIERHRDQKSAQLAKQWEWVSDTVQIHSAEGSLVVRKKLEGGYIPTAADIKPFVSAGVLAEIKRATKLAHAKTRFTVHPRGDIDASGAINSLVADDEVDFLD